MIGPALRGGSLTDSVNSYDPRPLRLPRGDPRLDSDDLDGDDPPPNAPQPPPVEVVPVLELPGPLQVDFPTNLGDVRKRNQEVGLDRSTPIDTLVVILMLPYGLRIS